MRKLTTIFFLLISISVSGQSTQYPAGIVYGPKAAFKISAPEGWILDNKSGLVQGLNCVLYLKDYTWENSPVIMYAKIASTNFEDVDNFIEFAYKEFIKEDPNFIRKEIDPIKINSEFSVKIFNYIGGPYHSYERAAYIQVKNAVCYVVFSSRNENDFKKYADSIFPVVKSFLYLPDYIGYKEK